MKIEKTNGFINYSISDMNDNIMVIDDVEVIAKRQGTGSELVKEVIEIAREQGMERVELYAYPQDDSIEIDSLVEFYSRLGFEIEYDCGEDGADMFYEI